MTSFKPAFGRFLKTAAVLGFLCAPAAFAQTPHEHIHHASSGVMPFDMAKTLHLFKMTVWGGVQRVVARDPAETDQIALIRQHLKLVAEKFQGGDYSDPAALHGRHMPGLEALSAGASDITIVYGELPAGAQLRFETEDLHLLTAIHRWFGAQLSDHGGDARAE